MVNAAPFPTPTPISATDAQQLQILHQIQSGNVSNVKALELYLSFMNFFPVSWKLVIYHFLSSLPISNLSTTALVAILVVGPFLTVAVLFFLFLTVRRILRSSFPSFLENFVRKPQEKTFLELTFPADTNKSAYATKEFFKTIYNLANRDVGLFRSRKTISLEIASSKDDGIRYVIGIPSEDEEVIKRTLLSYLPGIKVQETPDYLKENTIIKSILIDRKTDPKAERLKRASNTHTYGAIELKLSNDFALPLNTQKVLSEHDPISYITGNMTKLKEDELIVFQILISPTSHQKVRRHLEIIRNIIYQGKPLSPIVSKKSIAFPSVFIFIVNPLIWLTAAIFRLLLRLPSFVLDSNGPISNSYFASKPKTNLQVIFNPYEQELSEVVKGKLSGELLSSSIRVFILSKNENEFDIRKSGLISSFGQFRSAYQSLIPKKSSFIPFLTNYQLTKRLKDLTSRTLRGSDLVLSISELSDLYHFPYTPTSKTEDMKKIHSTELSAPLKLKNNNNLDVIFGKNTYGGKEITIGLTDDDRSRHVYMIGQTGSGKSTVIYHMAKDDIQRGRGIAVIDPHGDLAEDLLSTIPKKRINECIYFNPFDIKFPIGINLLELTTHHLDLDDDELEQEKELVCESVISIFRRVFTKNENIDAHRIEYILRNTIYTAFTVKGATIFTVYDLLTDTKFQKSITKNLEDGHLKSFWTNEFGKAGSYQVIKMISGVTAKVGRFLFSPTARRILEQPHSTINFDDILDSEKILICNLAEGKLGEDTSQLLGTTIIAKIHQAAMRRARQEASERTPFYLFIDEFQNFATTSFTKLLSSGRKFGLRLTIAEQSTAQQDDHNIADVILANTGTVICFRTASPIDEELMLSQFAPYVDKGKIGNLPRYHFYMKLSALEPEEPFSGTTFPIVTKRDQEKIQNIIGISRKNYAVLYRKPKSDAKEIKATKTTKLDSQESNQGERSIETSLW